MTTVLAFGTFDRFHEGHAFVLRRAAELGDRLVVAVARDAHVRALKQKEPKQTEGERLERVKSQPGVAEVRLSDVELGTYRILSAVMPDVIALGHDQLALRDNLVAWMEGEGIRIPIRLIDKML